MCSDFRNCGRGHLLSVNKFDVLLEQLKELTKDAELSGILEKVAGVHDDISEYNIRTLMSITFAHQIGFHIQI